MCFLCFEGAHRHFRQVLQQLWCFYVACYPLFTSQSFLYPRHIPSFVFVFVFRIRIYISFLLPAGNRLSVVVESSFVTSFFGEYSRCRGGFEVGIVVPLEVGN